MRQVTIGAPCGDRDGSAPFTAPHVGEEACLDFYARLASGVTVVTAQGPDGPAGSTVSAVTSLSADPPLLLACMGTGSRTLSVIGERGRFAVNLLPQSQRARAKLFADPGSAPPSGSRTWTIAGCSRCPCWRTPSAGPSA